MSKPPRITVTTDGPYRVDGPVDLIEQTIATNDEGESVDWRKSAGFAADEQVFLCRCGKSGNKPFCDNSHEASGFEGTEVADRAPYAEAARTIEGPRYHLMDRKDLCATARFCDTRRTAWKEVLRSDDAEAAAVLRHQVHNCPSGRLVLVDAESGRMIEQDRPKRISTTQDPAEDCSGPLFVEGGVSLFGADGERYEQRTRMTLCRCGASGNKPFCDGTHTRIGWTDGREK